MKEITRKDRVEIETIRKELGVGKVSERMKEKRLRWLRGSITRIFDDSNYFHGPSKVRVIGSLL